MSPLAALLLLATLILLCLIVALSLALRMDREHPGRVTPRRGR